MPPTPMRRRHVLIIEGRQHTCQLLEVSIVFYEGHRQQSRHLVKRLLHSITDCIIGGYTHCEMLFRTHVEPPLLGSHEATLGCSVEWDGTVTMNMRSYTSELWRFFPLPLTQQQIEALYDVCMRDAERAVAFNSFGFFWNFVCPFQTLRYDARGERVFCSEHALRSLRAARVDAFHGLVPYETHPQRLFEYLEGRGLLLGRRARPGANLSELTV